MLETEVMLLKDSFPFSTHPLNIIKLRCSFLFIFYSPYCFSFYGVLVTVFQRYIGYSIWYIEIYMRRFIIGTGSCDYSGQEGPRSAICKLENQEAGGIIQSKSKVQTPSTADITSSPRPKTWELDGGMGGGQAADISPEFRIPKARKPGAPISKRRRRWTSLLNETEREFALLPP